MIKVPNNFPIKTIINFRPLSTFCRNCCVYLAQLYEQCVRAFFYLWYLHANHKVYIMSNTDINRNTSLHQVSNVASCLSSLLLLFTQCVALKEPGHKNSERAALIFQQFLPTRFTRKSHFSASVSFSSPTV